MTAAALLGQKPLFEKYLGQCLQNLSGFSFVNLFAWHKHWQYELEIIDDNLCVFARNDLGVFLYLPPLGKAISAKAVAAAFEIMDKGNKSKGYSRIENVSMGLLPAFPENQYARYMKGYEYCYYRRDIVEFKGRDYKSKRNAFNHFTRAYKSEYLPFAEDMAQECAGLYDEWFSQRQELKKDDVYQQMLEENRDVHQLVIRQARDLGLTGRVVKVDGRVRAYTFGYPLNENMFCVLFEIADLGIQGLPVFIFREFCADPEVRNFQFINVMDDFGMDNIARTKMSFKPGVLLPGYVISRV